MFYHQMDGLAMEGPVYATTAEIYTQAHEKAAILSTLHTPKVWERFVDDIYSFPSHQQSSSKH